MENGDASEKRAISRTTNEKKQCETKLSGDRMFFLKYEDIMPATTGGTALER